jgi:hypothetical protein
MTKHQVKTVCKIFGAEQPEENENVTDAIRLGYYILAHRTRYRTVPPIFSENQFGDIKFWAQPKISISDSGCEWRVRPNGTSRCEYWYHNRYIAGDFTASGKFKGIVTENLETWPEGITLMAIQHFLNLDTRKCAAAKMNWVHWLYLRLPNHSPNLDALEDLGIIASLSMGRLTIPAPN